MDKPVSLSDIYARQDFWRGRQDRARKRAAAAEKTAERCYRHLGPVRMVEQIAELLKPYFPEFDLEVLGPFGLTAETSIHVNDPTRLEGRQQYPKTVGSLTFRPADEGRLRLVDRSSSTGEFAPNTLGALNGMNYREIDLPPTVDDLAALLAARVSV